MENTAINDFKQKANQLKNELWEIHNILTSGNFNLETAILVYNKLDKISDDLQYLEKNSKNDDYSKEMLETLKRAIPSLLIHTFVLFASPLIGLLYSPMWIFLVRLDHKALKFQKDLSKNNETDFIKNIFSLKAEFLALKLFSFAIGGGSIPIDDEEFKIEQAKHFLGAFEYILKYLNTGKYDCEYEGTEIFIIMLLQHELKTDNENVLELLKEFNNSLQNKEDYLKRIKPTV